MNIALRKLFQMEVERIFVFLVKDYGFAAPIFHVDESASIAKVTFKGENVAIELMLNERDEDLDCKIAMVSHGEVTNYYGRSNAGALCRESLFAMLVRKGERSRLFTKVSALPLEKRIPGTLDDFARMLKDHRKSILAGAAAIFD